MTKESNEKNVEAKPLQEKQQPFVAKLYPQRWWIVATVALINFINYGHWNSIAAITKTAALYYDQPGDKIDLLVIIPHAVTIPLCLVAGMLFNKFGLRFGLISSAVMTGLGAF